MLTSVDIRLCVESLGATFDETTAGGEVDDCCDETFEDIMVEINCRAASRDIVTPCPDCCVVTGKGVTFEEDCRTPTFDADVDVRR